MRTAFLRTSHPLEDGAVHWWHFWAVTARRGGGRAAAGGQGVCSTLLQSVACTYVSALVHILHWFTLPHVVRGTGGGCCYTGRHVRYLPVCDFPKTKTRTR